MKILYAIQATGNGHLARAQDIIPILKEISDLDILVSGINNKMFLEHDITYRLHGISFIFGKNGGADFWQSIRKLNLFRFLREIKNLPIENYDLIINDFEPVSAWASWWKGANCISLSHQSAVIHPDSPKARHINPAFMFFMKYFAPSKKRYGLHFSNFADRIYTPIIRKKVREHYSLQGNYYTVYLPSYSDKRIAKFLSSFPQIQWEVFSKEITAPVVKENIRFYPIGENFVKSMAESKGVLCGAGFETPSEALHLKKKLIVVPMKGQYEQQCNAAALEKMGVPVINTLNHKGKEALRQWLLQDKIVLVGYKNQVSEILTNIISEHG